jgi:hypothetical protein
MVWGMHLLLSMVGGIGYRAYGYGVYAKGISVATLVLVWSMVYVLYKILICSKFNYFGLVDTMTSKGNKWPRIALKCVNY